jgi:hypothetical protein
MYRGGARPVTDFTDKVICNGTYLRTQPPAHVPLLRIEPGEIGRRRADCGSAVAVIYDVTILVLLPFLLDLYTVPDRTFRRDDTVTCEPSSAEIQLAAAVLNTVNTHSLAFS